MLEVAKAGTASSDLLIELIERARVTYDEAEEAGEYSAARRLLELMQRLARELDQCAPRN